MHARESRQCRPWSVGNAAAVFTSVTTAGAEHLGELDPAVPVGLAARHPPGHDHRILRREQQIGGARDLGLRRLGQDRRRKARRVRQPHLAVERALLHGDIETDVGRPIGRRAAEDIGAQHRFDQRAGRARRVVPLDEMADHRRLVAGVVDPVNPRRALGRVVRTGRAHHVDRHAIDPGVVDAHDAVHQADVGVHDHAHRLVGDLGVALRDRDRDLLVEREHHGRVLVAEIVDQAVVQSGEARSRILHDVADAEPAQHLGGDVAHKAKLGVGRDRRPFGLDGLMQGSPPNTQTRAGSW